MTNILHNKYLSGFVSLLLALYAVYVAPELPNEVLQFFDTPIGRLLFIFLAAYLASEGNTQVALMVSIALTISLMAMEKKSLEESFAQQQVQQSDQFQPSGYPYEGFQDGDGSSNPSDLEPQGTPTNTPTGASVDGSNTTTTHDLSGVPTPTNTPPHDQSSTTQNSLLPGVAHPDNHNSSGVPTPTNTPSHDQSSTTQNSLLPGVAHPDNHNSSGDPTQNTLLPGVANSTIDNKKPWEDGEEEEEEQGEPSHGGHLLSSTLENFAPFEAGM